MSRIAPLLAALIGICPGSAHAWRWSVPGVDGSFTGFQNGLVSSDGDVVAAGLTGHDCDCEGSAALVMKLAGNDGTLRWDGTRDNCVDATVVGAGPDGDVIVHYQGRTCELGQSLSGDPTGSEWLRLAGDTGEVRWRQAIEGAPRTSESRGVLDPSGDVVITDGGTPVKLSGDDGRILWRADPQELDVDGKLESLVILPHGDVLVVLDRSVRDETTGQEDERTEVVTLDAGDGRVRWRRQVPGCLAGWALDAAGNLVVATTTPTADEARSAHARRPGSSRVPRRGSLHDRRRARGRLQARRARGRRHARVPPTYRMAWQRL